MMFKVSISSDRMCPLRFAYFTSMRVENCWSQGTWGADCMLGKASSQAPGGIEAILTSASSTTAVLTALRSLAWSCQAVWWSAAAVTALCPSGAWKILSMSSIHPAARVSWAYLSVCALLLKGLKGFLSASKMALWGRSWCLTESAQIPCPFHHQSLELLGLDRSPEATMWETMRCSYCDIIWI